MGVHPKSTALEVHISGVPREERTEQLKPTNMIKYVVFTLTLCFALVSASEYSDACEGLCNAQCTFCSQLCMLSPLDEFCAPALVVCNEGCADTCGCLDGCITNCPAPDFQDDPITNTLGLSSTAACRETCRAACGVKFSKNVGMVFATVFMEAFMAVFGGGNAGPVVRRQ